METVSQVCPSIMSPRRRLRHMVVALLALLVVGLSVGERPARITGHLMPSTDQAMVWEEAWEDAGTSRADSGD